MSHSDIKVECGTHGTINATFLCKHLIEGEKRGFNLGVAPENQDDLYPDAWCDEYEKVLMPRGDGMMRRRSSLI